MADSQATDVFIGDLYCAACDHIRQQHSHGRERCLTCPCEKFVDPRTSPNDRCKLCDHPRNCHNNTVGCMVGYTGYMVDDRTQCGCRSFIEFVEGVPQKELVNHPAHYGGDTTYEVIKVIEAWGLNFHLGNCVKDIARADRKGNSIEDLEKAKWYLQREIDRRTALS